MIANIGLLFPFALANAEHNIVVLSLALLKALGGDSKALADSRLIPANPFPSEEKKVEEETLSAQEVENWISNS